MRQQHHKFLEPISKLASAVLLSAAILRWVPISILLLIHCAAALATDDLAIHGYAIVKIYPHERDYFTQGLVIEDGIVFEGTGLWGKSQLIKYDLVTGKIHQKIQLPKKIFGEGIAVTEDKIFQLSYRARRGFVYNKSNFNQEREFQYPTEGWGLAYDGQQLIKSDGSASLVFLDLQDLNATRTCVVTAAGRAVKNLNELEYVQGLVYANIWQQDLIARINPDNCKIVDWINLAGLLDPKDRRGADVLNGIAYDKVNGKLYVTGKLWPKIFEIRIVPKTVP